MTDTLTRPVVDVLYRGRDGGIELRSDTSVTGGTLFGHFSQFDALYEIDSWIEGRFLERTVKGAYKKTIRENRNSVVCSFDHGFDPSIGDKPMGPIDVLREDDTGPYYEVPLLDTDYNRDFILPALEGRTLDGRTLGSVLGASFRFRVIGEKWDRSGKVTAENPEGLPLRTITEVRLFEFGPVVYPASAAATASVRSLTDHYFTRSIQRAGHAGRALAALGHPSPPAAVGTEEKPTIEPLAHSEANPISTRSAAQWRAELMTLRKRTQ
jgi:phage head maturation protease